MFVITLIISNFASQQMIKNGTKKKAGRIQEK